MSINSEILAIKVAGLNHKQIKQVLIGEEANKLGDQGYPLMRIWPAPGYLGNQPNDMRLTNSYAIAVEDRHFDDNTSALEAISDSEQILRDIVATIHYMYREDRTFNIIAQSSLDPYYDSSTDIVGGMATIVDFKKSNTQDFCAVPSRDFDFPVVNLSNTRVIDEGGASATYTGPFIIEGGAA